MLNEENTTDNPDPEQTQKRERAAISDPKTLRLFYEPPGTLRLTVDDRYSVPTVRLFQAAPLSKSGRYLSLLDGRSEEISMVETLDDFTAETRAVAQEELGRRYLTARIEAITEVRTEFGVTYWHVQTDRGQRDFVVQSLTESCIWLSDSHLLFIDADGNRFEIADRNALDASSKEQLAQVL